MKKNLLFVLTILILSASFVGCSWCPVGNPWDYENIEDNSAYYQTPYPLSSGKSYHAESMLRNNPYGCGNSYKFKADANVHCQFAVKLYQGKSEFSVEIDGEEIENPKNGFDVPKGSELMIRVSTDYYLVSGSPSAFAEFYLYVE